MSEGGRGLAGMSVNERLVARGLLAAWEEAVRARDADAMTLLLRRAAVPDAPRVAAVVLADPAAYGF
ncbi:hypothetical protein ACM61V_12045 [Sphingomonas sp. TX0543]|uniref:hypothetical protein n=1 Tax=unclassified Sphingomonas TaxID=196159 RepID=UPI0010F96029|nr:hypothetical protein [Sphingomonas sp. 3P27F8]